MSVLAIPDAVAINIASQCDRGKVRDENRATVRHTSTRLGDLLVVAEDISMFASGGQASRMAVDTISSTVEGMPAFFPPEIAVEEAVCHANAAIAAAAAEPGSADSRMGATAVVALLRTDADHTHAPAQAIIGYVGNCRAYLVHDQKLTLLTRDHSAAQDQLDSGQITPNEAETHPDESPLTRYLGLELNVRVEMHEVPLEIGDILLLCSDGLWNYVPEQEIERILADGTRSAEDASRALLNLALDAGGHDNVAIEMARLIPGGDAPAAVASAVEPLSEALPEIKPAGGLASAPDMSQSDQPNTPIVPEEVNSPAGLQPPKKERVFSLIRNLGKRITSKEAIVEKPAAAEPAVSSDLDVQPAVSWGTPEPIAYGSELSSVQLNATASVRGRFFYTPGTGYVLPAGTHTLWVAFSAAESPEDKPVLAEVSITVSKATPSIEWPTPANIPTGVALGPAQLNATASVPGTFEYSPAAGELLSDGTHTLSVTFEPADKANYTTARATLSVTVAKTIPKIDWASPEPIPFGTPLGPAELNASASFPGNFEYSPAAGEVLSAGAHTLSVTFIPSDETSCATASATVPLTVTRETPVLVWPAPERITYGAALSDIQLNATAPVPGTFVYTPSLGAVLTAGEHTPSVIFTPSNLSDYTPAHAAVSLSVAKATPAVSWPVPHPINSAIPLGSAQLNASASEPGTFAYRPATGETLAPGAHTLSVTFTPANSVNYTSAQASVSLTVTEIVPASISWVSPSSISYGTPLGGEQLSASSEVTGSFLYSPTTGDVLPPGEHKISVIFTPEDQERYLKVTAAVTLIVEGPPNIDPLLGTTSQTPSASGVATQHAVTGAAEREVVRKDDRPAERLQRETRTYKGAIYQKGDDGQWHLQREK
jgi:serine/threonine protein phosphatase PrpC